MPQGGSTSNANAYDEKRVGDWWLYNSTTRGNPRMLAPEFHTWDEPLELSLLAHRRFPAYGMAWMDGKGWGRYLAAQPKNRYRRSMIGFDSSSWPANTPAIKLTGCRAIEISGVNLFRSTPGVLTYDTNASGQNSAGIVLRNIGYGTRYNGDSGYVDPYSGLGLIDQSESANRAGYYGHATEGTNGTDSALLDHCEFFYLESPICLWSPQTTRLKLSDCFFRWNDSSYLGEASPNGIGEASGSGNIYAENCSWYDNGPFRYRGVKSALSSLTIVGGWYDHSDGLARTFIDASAHSGILNINIVGMDVKDVEVGSIVPFVLPRENFEEQTRIAGIDPMSVPGNQPLLPGLTHRGVKLCPFVIERAGPPTETNPEFDLQYSGCVYRNSLNGEMHFLVNVGSTLYGVPMPALT